MITVVGGDLVKLRMWRRSGVEVLMGNNFVMTDGLEDDFLFFP